VDESQNEVSRCTADAPIVTRSRHWQFSLPKYDGETMSEPTPPDDEVAKPKDRFAGVPSIEDTLASFAAGMQ